MIAKQIIEAARPYLENSVITDCVIGLSLCAIELDQNDIGLACVLRENLPAGCSVFDYTNNIIGANALDAAQWLINGQEDCQRALGMAVLTAAAEKLTIPDDNFPLPFGLTPKPTDIIGMIGYVKPVARVLEKEASRLIIFDMGITERGKNEGAQIYPVSDQPELLPQCDIVILSGTTIINHTIDDLLPLCKNAREVVLVGSSVPMFAEGFRGTGVTKLAGSQWDKNHKSEIFKRISLACGISSLNKIMVKKVVTVI